MYNLLLLLLWLRLFWGLEREVLEWEGNTFHLSLHLGWFPSSGIELLRKGAWKSSGPVSYGGCYWKAKEEKCPSFRKGSILLFQIHQAPANQTLNLFTVLPIDRECLADALPQWCAERLAQTVFISPQGIATSDKKQLPKINNVSFLSIFPNVTTLVDMWSAF